MDTILAASFMASMRASSGSDLLLFKRIHVGWEFSDRSTFESAMTDVVVYRRISVESDSIIKSATSQLAAHQPRDDYRTLLETIMFLGAVPSQRFLFRALDPCTTPAGCRKQSTC